MSRGVAILALVLMAGGSVFAQNDKDEEKKLKKEAEKKVADAIKAFKTDCSKGGDGIKSDAIKKLAELFKDKSIVEKLGTDPMEKVLAELTPCLKETDLVRKTAIQAIATIDHPLSGDALASAVGDCMKSKDLAQAIVDASDKCKWDKLYAELSNRLMDKCFDKDLSGVLYGYLGMLEKGGPLSAVEGLIKLLKKIEDNDKNGSGNPQYKEQVKKAIKSCTGEDKATSKDYETWWKANKEQIMGKARIVHWCSQTGLRWDALASDSKAYCSHHGDKKLASKDKPIVAFVTLK
jgi:predicted metalloendopeptidase